MKESGRKQGTMSPCAACKLLRRRCTRDCVFAPYFPADEPQKFGSVHKVFGASNVNKMLQELPEHQRSDAVSSMVYEANARVRDPVYGCVGAISSLQQQVDVLQTQLALAQAEVVHMRMSQFSPPQPPPSDQRQHQHQEQPSSSLVPDPHHEPSNSSSENLYHSTSNRFLSSQTKSLFGMDMVIDQANMVQSLWSY